MNLIDPGGARAPIASREFSVNWTGVSLGAQKLNGSFNKVSSNVFEQ